MPNKRYTDIWLIFLGVLVQSKVSSCEISCEKDRQCIYNVILRRVRLTIFMVEKHYHHHHYDHLHISVMESGHLLTRSGLTYPEVSWKVYLDSFCQLASSISLPWVIYFEAFYLHVVTSFSCIPVICPKLVLFLNPLRFVHLFCNLSVCPAVIHMYFISAAVILLASLVLTVQVSLPYNKTGSASVLSSFIVVFLRGFCGLNTFMEKQ